MTILVTGATGNVASALIPTLLAKGEAVRAMVRDESKAQGLRDQGAGVVIADMDRPETLDAAVAGADKIYFLIGNGPNGATQGLNLVAAIQRSGGNPHVVRHGMFGDPRSRIAEHHREIDAALAATDLAVTTLRPTFFTQNVMAAIPTVTQMGQIYWAAGEAKIAMVDVRDIAESAAAVLTSDGHEGKSYVLTGPEAVSFTEVASALSGAIGKDVAYIDVPNEALVGSMTEMGVPEWTALGYAELMDGFKAGWADAPHDGVQTLTGHAARSINDFARDFAGYFGAPVPV
jgi:uncharacterized protein YbjT (DUF2867 family)